MPAPKRTAALTAAPLTTQQASHAMPAPTTTITCEHHHKTHCCCCSMRMPHQHMKGHSAAADSLARCRLALLHVLPVTAGCRLPTAPPCEAYVGPDTHHSRGLDQDCERRQRSHHQQRASLGGLFACWYDEGRGPSRDSKRLQGVSEGCSCHGRHHEDHTAATQAAQQRASMHHHVTLHTLKACCCLLPVVLSPQC